MLALLSTPSSIVAQQITSLAQLKINNTDLPEDRSFTIPSSIVVVPIFPPQKEFDLRPSDWYRGLHYFLTASENHPGFTDIPFHYVVTKEGRIFTGNIGGEERKISISGIGDKQVVVGYLANINDREFDPRSEQSLGSLLVNVASRHRISLAKISVTAIRYVRNDASQTVSLEKADTFGGWSRSLDAIVSANKNNYKPQSKSYTVEVLGLELPKEEVAPGEIVTGKITIANRGEFGIYAGSDSEMLATHKNGQSKFYTPGEWASTSQFFLAPEDDVLLPQEERVYDFSFRVPLFWGKQEEKYHIRNLLGKDIAGSDFKIGLNIKRPSGTIVEVKPNSAGFIIARQSPFVESAEVRRLTTGTRYKQIDTTSNGWAQVDLEGGQTGWVAIFSLSYL